MVNRDLSCHRRSPKIGPAGPSVANFVAIDGPARLSMAAMDPLVLQKVP